ncbi:chymotrypsin-like elastase family member 1 isoform X2 [Rhopilema esculentum]
MGRRTIRRFLLVAVLMILAEAACARSLPKESSKSRNRRMIRGRDATFEEWRFIAYLNFHQPYPQWKVCGGSLVARNWVLTAAHCVEDIHKYPEFLSVTVGRTKRGQHSEHTYKVKKIVVYKDYFAINSDNATSQDYFNWDYDIALLKLNDSVQHDFVELAKLPEKSLEISELSNVQCKAAGWGSQRQLQTTKDVSKKTYNTSDNLQEIDVPLKTKALCKLQHGQEVSGLVFCGGELEQDSMTSCIGDSGSPLVCNGINMKTPVLAGIVIGGNYFCKTGKEYMMFTEVAKYRKWINHYLNC